MNRALYRAMLKQHGKKILSYSGGIVLYEWLLCWVYPAISKSPAVAEIAGSFPTSVKSIFGVSPNNNADSFEAYISAQFYGRIWTMIMAVYGINAAEELIAKLVEEGFMAYPLSTPVSRAELVSTQAAFLVSGFGAITGITMLGLFLGTSKMGIEINKWRYFLLTLLGFAFFSAMGSYSLFFSSLFNGTDEAVLYSAAMTLIFYALDVISGLDEQYYWMGKFSLFSFYKPQEVLDGSVVPLGRILALAGISFALFKVSGAIFARKDVPV